MRVVVEVGGWEHECCGPTYERDSVVDLTCHVVPGRDGGGDRYVEFHHDDAEEQTLLVRGRVADLCLRHTDGSTERIERLPSGSALRGFDPDDDGRLVRPGTGEPVLHDTDRYLVVVEQPEEPG